MQRLQKGGSGQGEGGTRCRGCKKGGSCQVRVEAAKGW